MKRTRVCDLLGIDYPIIQGAMAGISEERLVSAVSNAGGLGVLSLFGTGASRRQKDKLAAAVRSQIRKVKSLTDKPFAVNLAYGHGWDVRDLADPAIEEGVKICTCTGGDPKYGARYLKDNGLTVLHLAGNVRHALKGEAEGVDAIIAHGIEAGGMSSREEIASFCLIPQIAAAVRIPVIAAGGIVDARGFVAALALGAEGIQMGTRFLATHECIVDEKYKQAIINAAGGDTMVVRRKKPALPSREVRPEAYERLLGGDVAAAKHIHFGEGAGQIHEILSVKEVIQSIVEGADRILESLR